MYIIIAGCGKVGSGLASKLSREGHDVVIIDFDEESFFKLDEDFHGLKITGVPFDQDVLKKAGVEKADAVAAVTPEDNVNIMVSQTAKDIYGVPRVLARIYNPARERVFHQFGLETICPTNLSVEIIGAILVGKTSQATCTIGSNTLSFHYEAPDKSYEGHPVGHIRQTDIRGFIIGIIRKGEFRFAYPDVIVEKEDVLVIANKID
jgi:trk system potassium uptake protein TrkA